MVSIDQLSVEFSARPLFTDVSFVINPKERIALVGKNGAGKSTLLKIIAGLQQPTRGCVSLQRDVTVGYLPQVMVLSDERTVMEEAETAFAHIREMQERIERLNKELAERTDYDSEDYMALVERFTHENDRYQMMGGQNYRAELERTLQGLGFKREDFDRPTSEFSGGWRMRIELAKLLLQKPDLLLLDEPTNHLDIGSIQWLEQFIATKANAVMLVSHDRAFINNVTNRTIEITCGRINDYKVKYDQYMVLRAERREQQLRAYENQQKEIQETKDFIERFRYKPTKSNQVQSRLKQLEKIVPRHNDRVEMWWGHVAKHINKYGLPIMYVGQVDLAYKEEASAEKIVWQSRQMSFEKRAEFLRDKVNALSSAFPDALVALFKDKSQVYPDILLLHNCLVHHLRYLLSYRADL